MEKIVEELKKVFSFKETTGVGDIVLVVAEGPQMLVYGLVKDIVRDETKMDEWWNVTLNLLAIPPREVVWKLRQLQFTGQEIFTMGGNKTFIKAVDFSSPASAPVSSSTGNKTGGKVLRLVK